MDHLSHELVKKHNYQGTICPLDEIASYVLKKINGHHRLAKTLIPEEVDTSVRYREGAVRTIPVNAYERSRSARAKCIKHHGRACAVCGYKMADLYGKVGERVIHVHHLRELASLGKEYEVDPIKDLRPVCPNCHAVLHTSTPAMSVTRLRKLLAECKPVRWPADGI